MWWIIGVIWAVLTALTLMFLAGCHVNEDEEIKSLDEYFENK